MKISILLATYNGGQRLRVQLNSILNQSYKDWLLYIHDDGSNDDTIAILKEYQKKADRIFILEDEEKGRGARDSFLWLLEEVESDYYMFCDQDDLWLPYKVEQSLCFIQNLELLAPNRSICIHTDAAVADSQYNVVASSLWKQSRVIPNLLEKINYIQVSNCVTGCTMMFNRKARDLALPANKLAPMHDFWVAYSTLANGGILNHMNKSTMLYCQHGGNEVGANNVNVSYFKKKFCSIRGVLRVNKQQFMKMNRMSGISFWEYLFCKVVFEVKRCFSRYDCSC